ncbi:MAG: hypothetical protein KIS81_12190 [Maricaulaceae bacterium]|nr:hypothetical protein [Maricaulaceae bacterium]
MTFKPVKSRPYGEPKAVVARLFEEAGGVPAVMDILEMSRTRVYALSDPDSSNEISYARVAKLTEAARASTAAKDLALRAGGLFMPLEVEVGDATWLTLASEASRRHARKISALMDALGETGGSPGEVDAAEAREILELLDAHLALMARKRAKLARIASGERDPLFKGKE